MFGGIVMSSADGVVACDTDGTVVWCNAVAAETLGLPRDEMLGRPLTAFVTPDAQDVAALQQLLVAGGDTGAFVTSVQRGDGRPLRLSAVGAVRRDAQGRIVGTAMILREVTAEERLQRELSQAVARSRARFDQSAQPQALLDIEGRILEVNDAACELLGWSREELVGRRCTELVHSADPDEVRRQLDLLRAGSMRAASLETTGVCKDGRQIPILVDVTAVRDPDGKTYELAVFGRDLRELREAERRLSSREAFFRGLQRAAADVTMVTDAEGALRYVTPSVTQVLGYEPDQVFDVLLRSLVHSGDMAGQEERRRRVLEVPGARERGTVRLRDVKGRWRWFDITATNSVQDPDIGGIVVNLREVTPEIDAQHALRESEARYRAIAETAQEGILAVSPEGETLFANERLAEILGLSLDEVYALGGTGIFPSADVGQAGRRLGARRPQTGPERSDVPYRHPDGTERVLLVSASPLSSADGSVLGSLAMVSDVTEQRAAVETLRRQALHDALTGLPNRLLFVDRLTLAAARQRRTSRGGTAVLFLDLDNFKLVNDRHGHETGDRVLVEVASRLAHAVRGTDTVARLGGDEFAVICVGTDSATAGLVASRIQQEFKEPIGVDGGALEVSMSIGVALSPPHQAEDLLRLADMAMYQAKATARGRVVTYDESLHDDDSRRLAVLRAVGAAMDEGWVPLRYERMVALDTGTVTGIHAAPSWEHPILGRLDAREALREEEATGGGPALQAALLHTATQEIVELERRAVVDRGWSLTVSLPPSAARDAGAAAAIVDQALTHSGILAARLHLQLDEATVLEDPEAAAALAERLHHRGVGLVVGGVGRAAAPDRPKQEGSTTHLRGLRLTGIEIDASVVMALGDAPAAASLAASLVALARTLGAGAGAAGVATLDQAAVLRTLGCSLARGPLWGPVVLPAEPARTDGDRR